MQLPRAAVEKLVPAQPQRGQGDRLSSPLVVSAVSTEASRVQGSQGDTLCKGEVGTRLCPSRLPSAEELETDRGTGICPMAARIGGSPVGFAEGASFYMEMKNLG